MDETQDSTNVANTRRKHDWLLDTRVASTFWKRWHQTTLLLGKKPGGNVDLAKITGRVPETFCKKMEARLYDNTIQRACSLPSCLPMSYTAGETAKLKLFQRSFTASIDSTKLLNYWDRLKALRPYSPERGSQRHVLLYTLRIPEGLPQWQSTGVHETFPRVHGMISVHSGAQYDTLPCWRGNKKWMVFTL